MDVSEELTLLTYGCTESARVYAIFKTPEGRKTSRLVRTPTEDEVFENWETYDRTFLYSVGVAHGRQFQMEKHRETEIELIRKLVEDHGLSARDLELLFNRSSSHIRRSLRAAGIPPMIPKKGHGGPKPQPVFPPGFERDKRWWI